MKTNSLLKLVSSTLLALAMAAASQADVVETKNGARLVGTIKKIDGGKITLSTAYAGDMARRWKAP
jgi:hypothetical protein